MGLDMYLTAKRFIWTDERKKIRITGISGIHSDKVEYITEEVLYWRKANAIHKWFVETVQGGNDDCGSYVVSIDMLKKLQKLCKDSLKLRRTEKCRCLRKTLLPTQEGFFFGSTDYDDDYYADLEYTVKGIDRLFKDYPKGWHFEYHSSW